MVVKSFLIETLKKHKPWSHRTNSQSSSFCNASKPRLNDAVVVSTNTAITCYCKNGRPDIARKLFDEMPHRTVVSWNAMICGYSEWERHDEALSLVPAMHKSSERLNETTFSKILSACARTRSFSEGTEVHCLVLKSGAESLELVGCALLFFYASFSQTIHDAERVFVELRGRNDLLWSVMLAGYVQCKKLNDAVDLFVKMPKRDVVAWTALISGHAKSKDRGSERRALELFKWMMRSDEALPNEFTLDCVVRGFGRLGLLSEGKAVHGLVVKYGVEFERSILGALIEFYCGCESVDCAKRVYEGIRNPCPNASSSLISWLISLGRVKEAEMIFDGLEEKDSVCSNLMIKGYAMSGRAEESKRLFENMTQKTRVSSNTMISVYSKNREIEKAIALFDETKENRDHITWNSMILGYVQNHLHDEALKLYLTMRRSSVDCTRSTFSVLLHSCSCLGSLQLGRSIHAQLTKSSLESNVYVGTSLVDMYSKCGSVYDADKSFIYISSPNVAAWTALINGYAIHGLGSVALCHFENMLKQEIAPNAATFVAILCACRYAGLNKEGLKIFRSMRKYFGVTPNLEHYACVVDLLGRSGKLQEAADLIEDMPFEADAVIWGALLSACWFWTDLKLGENVAEKMFGLEPKPVYAYNILANIYAALGKWGENVKLRKSMRGFEAKKIPGCSWIELNEKVHLFYVEDKSHLHCSSIYATLKHLTANTNSVV